MSIRLIKCKHYTFIGLNWRQRLGAVRTPLHILLLRGFFISNTVTGASRIASNRIRTLSGSVGRHVAG